MVIEADLTNLDTVPGEHTVALVVEGEGSSNWKRIVLEPYEENDDRLNILPAVVIQ